MTPDLDHHCPGGTAWYFAWGIHHLMQSMDNVSDNESINFRLITSVGPTDLSAVEQLRAVGISVDVLPSLTTVYFENRYGANMNQRRQRVLSRAFPFTWERLEPLIDQIPADEPACFVLGSLLADDFPLDVIERLHRRGRVVVDVQGYLREVVGEEVRAIDWTEKKAAAPYIDYLKTNEYEMEVLTGFSDELKAARQLADWGVGEVLLTFGDGGSIIAQKDADGFHVTRIPAFPPHPLVDATGCGDTYTMAYLLRRLLGSDVYFSGVFAAAVSTIKLQHSGPFCGTYLEALKLTENV